MQHMICSNFSRTAINSGTLATRATMTIPSTGGVSPRAIEEEIANTFDLNPKERGYLSYHARRFAYCTGLVLSQCKDIAQPRILDVAPHFTTFLLRRHLPAGSTLNSLGWFDERIVGPSVDRHFAFDLNEVHFRDRWITPEEHDVVLAGEIIEHLFTLPDRFLAFIAGFIKPGGTLILCTPNAASLRHRAKLALGRNPFEMITERRDGHVREYTKDELRNACTAAGLEVRHAEFAEYWPERGVFRLAERVVPGFRRGITIIAQKPLSAGLPTGR